MNLRIPVVIAFAGCLAACVTPPKYNWGSYNPSLYSYYKEPAKAGELTTALEAVINDARKTHRPVAPGLYAEYGYLLLQSGKSAEAVAQFQSEKDHWPESKPLMERMIALAQKEPTKSTEQGL